MFSRIWLQGEGKGFLRGLLLSLAFFKSSGLFTSATSTGIVDQEMVRPKQSILDKEAVKLRLRKLLNIAARSKAPEFLTNFVVRACGPDRFTGECIPFLKVFGDKGAEDGPKSLDCKNGLCSDLKSAGAVFLVKELGARIGKASGLVIEAGAGIDAVLEEPKVTPEVLTEWQAHKVLAKEFAVDAIDVLVEELGNKIGELRSADKAVSCAELRTEFENVLKQKVFLQKFMSSVVKAFMQSPSAQRVVGMDLASEQWQNAEKGLFVLSKYVVPKAGKGCVGKAAVKFCVELLKKRISLVDWTSAKIEKYLLKSSYTREFVDKVVTSVVTTYLLNYWNRLPAEL